MALAGKEQDLHTAAAEDRETKASATIAAAALSDQLSGLSEQLRASKEAIERSETDMTDQEVKGEEKLQVCTFYTTNCRCIVITSQPLPLSSFIPGPNRSQYAQRIFRR